MELGQSIPCTVELLVWFDRSTVHTLPAVFSYRVGSLVILLKYQKLYILLLAIIFYMFYIKSDIYAEKYKLLIYTFPEYFNNSKCWFSIISEMVQKLLLNRLL